MPGCFEPGGSLMYAIPPAGRLSGPEGEGLSQSIKRALHTPCTGDRWSLMLPLTSNLASVIIKPSFLDVTLWCDPPPPPKKILFFWQKKLKWDFSCTCVWGAGRKMGSSSSRCSRMFLLINGLLLLQLVETGVTHCVTTEPQFSFKIGSFFHFFPPPVCVAVSHCRSELCLPCDSAMIKTQTHWAAVLQGSVGPAWQLIAEATVTKTKSTGTGCVIRCCYVCTFVCVCFWGCLTWV